MIKTIRTENIYSVLSGLTALTTKCKVYSQKPIESSTNGLTTSYLYLSKVTDNPLTATFSGYGEKVARVAFTIVCKSSLGVNETPESVLFDIIDILNNELAQESCNKIDTFQTIQVSNIIEGSESPIFYNEKQRPYIVKDYLFTYYT